MPEPQSQDDTRPASAPLEMSAEEFRALGHGLVDKIAAFIESAAAGERPAAPDLTPEAARALVGQGPLPQTGVEAGVLLDEAAELIFGGCRLNGHPKSWGYIIGSPAPLGILADFLASAVNPNLAAWYSAPVPTEIEAQAVRWIAEFLGYPADCGGLLVSGGNMANFVGVLAARKARAGWDLRAQGLAPGQGRLRLYASQETHTWVQKAADLFGFGTDAIQWIPTDQNLRMDITALEARIRDDKANDAQPLLVIGSAGTVSTGAVDPLPEIAALAREHGLWFHVDGAYGAPAVAATGAPEALKGLREADSLAVDAHKWLYLPLEAGCVLVRDRQVLRETFAFRPPYYHYPSEQGEVTHYHEYGPQNSRGFRALKVWLALRRAGRADYAAMIEGNLALARALRRYLDADPEIETATQDLSINTFRFVPAGLDPAAAGAAEDYLNDLNARLVIRIQRGGEAFLSNAVIDGKFLLRACITNFRSRDADVRALPGIVTRLGRELDTEMRPKGLKGKG